MMMKKKKTNWILLLGAMALAASCAKEAEQIPSGPVSLKARIADETKATLSETDGTFAFTSSDAIKVYNGTDVYASTKVTVEGTTATFTMADGFTNSGSGYAAYPASSVTDITASGVTFTLPSSYTYDQVSGINVPCPMMATYTAGDDLEFKQAGSIIRFRIKNCLAGDLTFTFKTEVTGEVTLTAVPSGVNDGIKADSFVDSDKYGRYSIQVTGVPAVTGEDVFYVTLPVPVGTDVKNVSVWNKGTGTTGEKYKNLTGEPIALQRAEGYKRGVTLADIQNPGATFGGLHIAGFLKFIGTDLSVEDGYSVMTDPLELVQYYGQTTDNYQSYFSWSEITENIPKLFTSQGIKIGNNYYDVPTGGAYGQWKTIAAETRPAAKLNGTTNARYAFIKVTGLETNTEVTPHYPVGAIRGLLIFPDNGQITVPGGASLTYLDNNSRSSTSIESNTVTKDALANLRSQGCLFLPAAGCYDSTEVGSWWDINYGGYYWSRTNYNKSEAYALAFTDKKDDGTPKGQFTISAINSVDNKHTACFPIMLIQL